MAVGHFFVGKLDVEHDGDAFLVDFINEEFHGRRARLGLRGAAGKAA
jgi:hypothetical protein